jgi:hypothetical protein
MIEGSRSGSVPLTNGLGPGSGSRRPENIWIRLIRIRNTELFLKVFLFLQVPFLCRRASGGWREGRDAAAGAELGGPAGAVGPHGQEGVGDVQPAGRRAYAHAPCRAPAQDARHPSR